jgi:hypothetical protein
VRRLKTWLREATDNLHWQHWVLVGVFIFVVSSTFTNATVIKQQDDIKSLQEESQSRGKTILELSKTNNQILDIVLEVTGPENQAEQDKRLERLVQRLDCNTQRVVQDALIELDEDSGLVMSPFCVQFFIDNPQL